MDLGGFILVALMLVSALIVVAVGWALFTRVGHGAGTSGRIPCCYRDGTTTAWQRGVLRFDNVTLELRSTGRRSRRVHRWRRVELDLALVTNLQVPETVAAQLPTGRDGVVCAAPAGSSLLLAIGAGSYTALRSWQEAAPPGWNANVA